MFFLIVISASHFPHLGTGRQCTSGLYQTTVSQLTMVFSFIIDSMLLKYQAMVHFNKLFFLANVMLNKCSAGDSYKP